MALARVPTRARALTATVVAVCSHPWLCAHTRGCRATGAAARKAAIQLKVVGGDDELLLRAPVARALAKDNALDRFVLIPPKTWPDVVGAPGGWTGKVIKVDKRGSGTLRVKTHDCKSGVWFTFSDAQDFKPLS